MIVVTCARCSRRIEVHDSQAGQPVTCPQCGNVNVAPAAGGDAPQSSPPVPTPPTPPADQDVKLWCLACHLSALSGFIGVPFGWVVGPLIVWLIKGKEIPAVQEHGKDALNFQISMTIYGIVAGLLIFAFVGFLLLPAVAIADLVLTILAGLKAYNGERFQYPLTIRFLK